MLPVGTLRRMVISYVLWMLQRVRDTLTGMTEQNVQTVHRQAYTGGPFYGPERLPHSPAVAD
jgi:hypothetical protein